MEDAFGLIGDSLRMRELLSLVRKAGASDAPVLIMGENGSGKEGVARALWRCSRRRTKPFRSVNCGALQDTLLETELFGHVKGAFTDATSNRKGLFEQADKGTLLLDEVGDTSPAMQVKLLRVLQEGALLPVGGMQEKRVDVRIVAATNKPLRSLVKNGQFREDLFFRLDVVRIAVPPLRERVEDIPALAHHFLSQFVAREERLEGAKEPAPTLGDEVLRRFASYPWPGNVRELKNLVERLAIMGRGHSAPLDETFLPVEFLQSSEGAESFDLSEGLEPLLKEHERRILSYALGLHPDNLTAAARQLGLTVSGLRYKCEKVGLFVPAGRLASARRG